MKQCTHKQSDASVQHALLTAQSQSGGEGLNPRRFVVFLAVFQRISARDQVHLRDYFIVIKDRQSTSFCRPVTPEVRENLDKMETMLALVSGSSGWDIQSVAGYFSMLKFTTCLKYLHSCPPAKVRIGARDTKPGSPFVPALFVFLAVRIVVDLIKFLTFVRSPLICTVSLDYSFFKEGETVLRHADRIVITSF